MKGIVEKGTQIKKLMNKVTNVEEEVQEIEEAWKQRVEAETRRDQDIQLTIQQIDKIKNDLQHIIDENGTGNFMNSKFYYIYIILFIQINIIFFVFLQNNR